MFCAKLVTLCKTSTRCGALTARPGPGSSYELCILAFIAHQEDTIPAPGARERRLWCVLSNIPPVVLRAPSCVLARVNTAEPLQVARPAAPHRSTRTLPWACCAAAGLPVPRA